MISNIFLYLVVAGFGTQIITKGNFERLLSLLLLSLLAFLTLHLYQSWQLNLHDSFTYHWITSRYNKVDINLFSTTANYAFIFPFFIISALMILQNIFYSLEAHKLRLNGLIFLNLAGLILLICSQNFIQLLVGACVIDVLGFYLINDMTAKKKYIFYNMIADLGLFMVFAILWGYLGSINIDKFNDYKKLGSHKDLVAIVLLICIFVKSGLFLFQNQLLDLHIINFNRLNIISFCSTPIAGIILLYKAYGLLPISEYSIPLLQIFAGASLIWGLLGALLMDNIKEKAIYLNIMFYALIYGLLSTSLISISLFSSLLVLNYLFINCLQNVVIASSNENYISRMGGFIKPIKISFAVTLVTLFAIFLILLQSINAENHIWIWSYLVALVLVSSYILQQIYLGQTSSDDRVWAMLKNPNIIYWLPQLLISAAYIYFNPSYSYELYAVYVVFLLLLFIGPIRKLSYLYDNDKLQEADWFSGLYNVVIITPVKILGRVLWLTIDFLIIEKTIISTLSNITNFSIRLVSKAHTNSWLSNFAFILLGWGIIIFFFYYGDGR